ncbi:2Fe-2S iron-sulfur cluster-binding protein [Thiohalobacter sp.]|uniref:2Fe-2S iron-sulfur cluster-binding protein n=1 Tax=Thiohalobacter sp. TaxID=2025948 RepID=UPI00260F60B8|nr:2Fe-2S iron-sulfur cluster-binding protein [Thiohalobacter sp.]
MSQLISLSRAARLVGVRRATLQKQIREGKLQTFEGELDLSELLRLYPQTDLDRGGMIERADRIIEQARGKASFNRRAGLPDAEVLAARLTELSHELATARARLNRYGKLVGQLRERLENLAESEEDPALRELLRWLVEQEREAAQAVSAHEELVASDTFMRLIAARIVLHPSGHDFFVEGSDTLLESALRAGLNPHYGCTDGSCGRCKARVVQGEVKRVRDFPECLSDEDVTEGYFTLCSHTAVTDAVLQAEEVRRPEQVPQQRLTAAVRRVEALEEDMRGLYLTPVTPARLQFLAGQSVVLDIAGETASFPVASCPCDATQIEIHVPRGDDTVSQRVFRGLDVGDEVGLAGPHGSFVLNTDSHHSLIFIAWHRNFAALKSLVEQAVALDASEEIWLYWLVPGTAKPYQHNLCRAWEDALDNVRYRRIPTDEIAFTRPDSEDGRHALIDALARMAEEHYRVRTHDFYIDAPHGIARHVKRYLIARGVPEAQIRTRE